MPGVVSDGGTGVPITYSDPMEHFSEVVQAGTGRFFHAMSMRRWSK